MLGRHMNASTATSSKSQSPPTMMAKAAGSAAADRMSVITTTTNEGARILTLNRPKALNALNKEMIDLMLPALQSWESSKSCNLVILKGEGRAFCAGGDVKALVQDAQNPETRQKSIDFFKQEYEGDRFIAHMQKPVIAILDGVTMGGGVGLSVHAPFRIATEKTEFAMPETKIGLFPDVGANFFLARLDGQLGTYIGATGDSLKGYGVYQAGIATHFVNSDRLPDLEERLAALTFSEEAPSTSQEGREKINACIEEFVADADSVKSSSYELVGEKRAALDTCFSHNTAEEIVESLGALEGGDAKKVSKAFAKSGKKVSDDLKRWARETREVLEFRSPTSIKIALEGVRKGKKLNIDQAFELDLQIASVCCDPGLAPDFVAGVDHFLVKREKTARAPWSPATLSDLPQSTLQDLFFSGKHGSSTKLSKLPPGPSHTAYTEYPHAAFALPSEQLIGQVVKGELKSSGSAAVTEGDVQNWFAREWNAKIGVREKVKEVLERRTTKGEDGTLRWRSGNQY